MTSIGVYTDATNVLGKQTWSLEKDLKTGVVQLEG